MPILHRVLLAFCVVIAIGAVQSAITVRNLRLLSAGLDSAASMPITQVDAAWRAWDAFRAAGTALSDVLDGIHDQPDAAAVARFRATAEPIDRELARALSGSAGTNAAARLPALVAQWKAAALVLLGEGATTAIAGLIGKTSTDVDAGVKLIGDTGNAISVIRGRVAEIDGLVASAATAAESQADNLRAVVTAVAEADRATQQNVRMGEQSAASVQGVHDQAGVLSRLIGQFRLGGGRARKGGQPGGVVPFGRRVAEPAGMA